ncbi:DUF485 domain-containing protein [Methylobacterium dankookense]|jgi:uncharacterized membrane protein (DUF485 family)|uniref:Inner membrane protein YjcH n=1 Tax=Methylobacterium dankookense TaxID=560405 RepID=A0A564G043_9HYPH|nr:DUF485 domain-containing protein [Methylobacterium dankookense]GJD55561.1 hypothetical protein IFDJLNFL_1448 [Methylobacterium dankookense]VUF13839.1 Inner membrane protein YjcH [Methylobacterium dankookense]
MSPTHSLDVTGRPPASTTPTSQPVRAETGTPVDRIVQSPQFRQLVSERTRFSWILTGLMLVVYFGFIGLIAFDKSLLAVKIGTTSSLGLVLGVGVIVFAFILTGLYVARANSRYDALSAELKRSLGQ